MKARVERRGEELIVVIPDEAARAERIEVNSEVEVRNTRLHPVFYMTLDEIGDRITPETLHGENVEVEVQRPYIVPADYMTLEEMCATITPETLHEETGWGPDVGKEIIEW